MVRRSLERGRISFVLLLVLGLAGGIGAAALWQMRAPTPAGRPAEVRPPPPAPVEETPATGTADAPDSEAAPPGATPGGIPLTELPLQLLATVVRGDPSLSLAALQDEEHPGHQIRNEGDLLDARPDVRLTRIERDHVLLDHAGSVEKLPIGRSRRGGGGSEAPPAFELSEEQRERRRDLASRLRDLTDAGTEWRGEEHRGGLLAEGDAVPLWEDGELIGIRITDIESGGVYDKVGLQDGDLVTSVNGVSLDDPGAAARLINEMASSDSLTVAVERGDGSVEFLNVATSDLIADLLALP